MSKGREIFVGVNHLDLVSREVKGEFIIKDGESHYKINNYDQMPPFFMTLTSDSDIWMFISSNGGLTAGRKNADHAIFPYYTDDQLTNLNDSTGSKSVFLVQIKDKWQLWTPFSDQYKGVYHINRNLYKNDLGNQLIFEEEHIDLGLTYRQSWLNSRKFGIIKKSQLLNKSIDKLEIQVLDGFENLMPPGIIQNVQQTKSNLANAYKKNELLQDSGIGIYSLSSNIIDRPEPSESLRATTVWSTGFKGGLKLLSSNKIQSFITGDDIQEEYEVRAVPGAYLLVNEIMLEKDAEKSWYFCADTNQSASDISDLQKMVLSEKDLSAEIEADIARSSENLKKLLGQADGFQASADKAGNVRHLSNTLFNVMRGGIFADGYLIDKQDLLDFIKSRNLQHFKKYTAILDSLPSKNNVVELRNKLAKWNNGTLERYAYEYLPLTFSRRHGDPTRPWNKFNIDVLLDDGSSNKSYEGNWRDIFQNWEALCYSFPEFTESIITLFLNASTIDGYNPYRITSNGIEWEIADPEDPWSFIGYWGDHQIIYLQKLLELSVKFHPQSLGQFLDKPFFTYANVPYRIKGYDKIVQNPYDTILYDANEELQIADRVKTTGVDGKLVWNAGDIVEASLTEKLLLTLLTKLSNFVPEGGIWMNTQRPEWNDANNALVGYGLSMVTVYYLHRNLEFLEKFYQQVNNEYFEVGVELEAFFKDLLNVFDENKKLLDDTLADRDRKRLTDSLGKAGETYRDSVYNDLSGSKTILTHEDLVKFLSLSKSFIRHTIRANKRSDGLYHAYNLLEINENSFVIKYLYPMLEGQVAILSSGFIQPQEALDILVALRESDLYREDQKSYILYPDRKLSPFIHKAVIEEGQVSNSMLLQTLVANHDDSIIVKDASGKYHFNSSICNAKDLSVALANLDAEKYGRQHEDRAEVLEIYEKVFHHHTFTGRSGTFFGYEGLGSVYWHMNSKLLLAVQEIYFSATNTDCSNEVMDGLRRHYYEIKEGLGTYKTPKEYGAFPTDPYSHTPANKGAQQPGMTGQVKEDILSRIGELGVQISDGCITFGHGLMRRNELLNKESIYTFSNLKKEEINIQLHPNEMAFSFCGIPIIYVDSREAEIEVVLKNGKNQIIAGNVLDSSLSKQIFQRNPEIEFVRVKLIFNS